jgi:H+/Cl- antiporter ClcA
MSGQTRPRAGGEAASGADAFTRSPGFWSLMRNAAIFGVVLALAALAFLGMVKAGTHLWFTLPESPGWLDGSLWWVAVTGGTGLLVGVLRRFFRLPAKLAGTVEELQEQRVEPSTVLQAVAVSAVSLAGGASLGPEDALGKLGGGLGTWVSERRKLDESTRATNTLTGMSGAYGGMLSSPILASILTLELARPKAERFAETLTAGLLSASVAFAVYFAIAGSTFVGLYQLPSFKYEDWQLLAAVPLGLVAGALALMTVVAAALMTGLTARLGHRTILRATIGGVAFGLVGVALPLTLFTGTEQLDTVIKDGATLGAGLLIAVVFAKILVFAVCEATGFIGGPFLVMLFIGGTAGTDSPCPGAGPAAGTRVHRDVRRPSRSACGRPFLAAPAGRPDDPDRHAADGTCGHCRPHRIPRRLGLGAAHGTGPPRTPTRPFHRNAGHERERLTAACGARRSGPRRRRGGKNSLAS